MIDAHIDIQNAGDYPIDAARLRTAAQAVLAAHDRPEGAALSVVVTDNDTVRQLNRQHRQIDAPTDVLSFPVEPLPAELQEADEPQYLGDLVIAYPYASAQADRHGHDRDESLALLVVHGTLHLLGYDHDTPEQRAAMWQAQADALRALGIDTAVVPTLEDSDHA